MVEVVLAWAALSVIVALFGRLVDNETVMIIGAMMMLFTCAFAV